MDKIPSPGNSSGIKDKTKLANSKKAMMVRGIADEGVFGAGEGDRRGKRGSIGYEDDHHDESIDASSYRALRQDRDVADGGDASPNMQRSRPRSRRPSLIVALAVAFLTAKASFEIWDLSTFLPKIFRPYARTSESLHSLASQPEGGPRTARRPHPVLHRLIRDFDSGVVANVSYLLDFAIVGFSKCGTSLHLRWLHLHPEILMYNREISSLRKGKPAELVSLMYDLEATSSSSLSSYPAPKRIGYKSPIDIMSPRALDALGRYWPDAGLVVGVRHPVTWFESYYNYHQHHFRNFSNIKPFGPAESMEIPNHAYFHVHLSRLGKTNASSEDEQRLLSTPSRIAGTQQQHKASNGENSTEVPVVLAPLRNPVFLYEVSQSGDPTDGRDVLYRADLEHFLGLSTPLAPRHRGERFTTPHHKYALDICQPQYAELRNRLVQIGMDAAEWILTYFVPHPDVTVSNLVHFRDKLKTWSNDPCIQE